MKQIKNFLERHTKLCLILLFILCILIYGNIARRMTVPIYESNDEDLYVNMARSFFYNGNFSREYQVLNYSCIIYSVILSLAYFFYNPENILFIMRMIGVIAMASSIIPVYLLSKDILKSKIKALGISALMLIIPDMVSGAYLIQENFSYPIFLWIAYLVYNKFTKKENIKRDILIIIAFAILFFTKSYTIVIAFAYFICVFVKNLKDKNSKEIQKIFYQGIAFISLIFLGYFIIYIINNFQNGVNHYDRQIMSIFPLNISKIGYFLYGIVEYLVFSISAFGVLPVLIPLFNYKEYEKEDREFLKFVTLSMIFTVIEVSAIVYIPEETGNMFPGKICVRYLSIFAIPYILMFLKLEEKDIKISKWIYIITAMFALNLIIYYIKATPKITGIDAYLYLTILTLNMKLNGAGTKLIVLMFGIILVWLDLKREGKVVKKLGSFIVILITSLIIIMPFNLAQPLYLSNSVAQGTKKMPDYIKLANFLKRDYSKVYAYALEDYYFFGILSCDYKKYYEEEELELEQANTAIIVRKDFGGKIEGAKKVDIGLETIDVYVSDETQEKVHIIPKQ